MKITSIGRKGFTLAEILISVAITVVLVAVAIPIMKDTMISSRESTCYSNQKAAQAEFSIGYVLGDYNTAISKSVLPADMAQDYSCPSGGTLFYEISATGDVTVSCSVHTDAGDGTHITVSQQDMDTIVAAIKGLNSVNQIDSEAVEGSNLWQKTLLAALQEKGLDLEALGIKSWRVQWDSVTGKKPTLRFEFTTAEISELKPNAKIPIIRYRPDGNPNGEFKGFSVWEASVVSKAGTSPYMIIGVANTEYRGDKDDELTAEDKQDINKIIDVYNKYNDKYNGAYPDI